MVPHPCHDGEGLRTTLSPSSPRRLDNDSLNSKSENTHVLGKANKRVLRSIQEEVVALARIMADEADLLVRSSGITVEDGPTASRTDV